MEHDLFLKRIEKSLYYGTSKSNSTIKKCNVISRPLAHYAAEIFTETHKGHSLNRLNFVTAGLIDVTPCSLILALIYLDRLKDTDPDYARRITPTELFLVSMVISSDKLELERVTIINFSLFSLTRLFQRNFTMITMRNST